MDVPCEFIGEGTVFPDGKGVPVCTVRLEETVGPSPDASGRALSLILIELVRKGGVRKMDGMLKIVPSVLND